MTALDYANKGLQGARKFLESAEKEGDSRKIRRGKRALKVYEEFVALLKRA